MANQNESALPPPARITPYSGELQDTMNSSNIIRPIAFRPIANAAENEYTSETSLYATQGRQVVKPKAQYAVNTPTASHRLSDTETLYKTYHKAESNHYATSTDLNILPNSAPSTNNNRYSSGDLDASLTAIMLNSGSNYSNSYRNYPSVQASRRLRHVKRDGNEENDYDTVPEFVDLLKEHLTNSELSAHRVMRQQNAQNATKAAVRSNTSLHQLGRNANESSMYQTQADRSPPLTHHHSIGNLTISNTHHNGTTTRGRAASTSRQSSGIHVTPSPSDSGVAELEAVLREKDSELQSLRAHMDRNEETTLRMYHEKEKRWTRDMAAANERARQAESSEARCMNELQRVRDELRQAQMQISTLQQEKYHTQQTVKMLEQQLNDIRNGKMRCATCASNVDANDFVSTSSQLSNDSQEYLRARNALHRRAPSVDRYRPASPTETGDLRLQLDTLRTEVSELRHQLSSQREQYTMAQNGWEREKEKVLSYQRRLQDNYVQISQRNRDLERQIMDLQGKARLNESN